MRGDVGGHSPSSSRTVGDPYDVHATRFPPDPHSLQFAGVWLETDVLGFTCRYWIRDVGAGRTRSCSAPNLGVGSYMLALGPTQWCWARNGGVGPYTCRRWVRDVGAGRTRWRSAQNVGVGSYTLTFSSWHMRSWGRNVNGSERRLDTHQI